MEWNEKTIKDRLARDSRWVCHALKILYDRQEGDEREDGVAKRKNGMGFNSTDAFFFSRLAEFYIKNGFLTGAQIAAARKGGIGKYWKQVLEVIKANEKIREERKNHEGPNTGVSVHTTDGVESVPGGDSRVGEHVEAHR